MFSLLFNYLEIALAVFVVKYVILMLKSKQMNSDRFASTFLYALSWPYRILKFLYNKILE